ncbi:hypothetical protein AGMMS49525_06960 [Bacteroidia bacterium]|nr:hypothetical protein AGMMS49525_06960 [Bacteroidia bacterium]
MIKKQFLLQAVKYGIVGVLNTLITFIVIWFLMRIVFGVTGDIKASDTAIWVSNLIGFVAGLTNSFLLNRRWTFKSDKNWKIDVIKFFGAFIVCYLPQLLLVWALNRYAHIPTIQIDAIALNASMLCQVIGMVFFTAMNFLINKYYTFNS